MTYAADDATPLGAPNPQPPGDDWVPEDLEQTKAQKAASTRLVELGQELYEFGVSDAGETYGMPRRGPKVVLLLRGGATSLRAQLAREYFRRHTKAAPQQSLADALLTLDGFAQEAQPRRLWQRVAQHDDGALWLDLGDATGRAVRITGDGWSVHDHPPVLFRRTALTGPLPAPEPGGNLHELWTFANVSPEDRPLLLAELCARFWPDHPHVVLGLFGEQGTGKSTAARVLVVLTDPGPVPLRKPPRDDEAWVTAAARLMGGRPRQPVHAAGVVTELDLPRIHRRRRRAPQAVHRRGAGHLRVPPLRAPDQHRPRRAAR